MSVVSLVAGRSKWTTGADESGRRPALSRIFISYRRDDADADAGRLYDVLAEALGPDSVYKDVDNVPLGVNWN